MKEISRNMNEKNKLKLKNYQLDLTLLRENQRLKIIIEEDNGLGLLVQNHEANMKEIFRKKNLL